MDSEVSLQGSVGRPGVAGSTVGAGHGSVRRRVPGLGTLLLALTLTLIAAAHAGAQQPRNLRVFLDCQTRGCSGNEFRTEIPWVDWVRDRTAADVHVIMTSQDTGAGTEFVFDFLGRGDHAGADFRLNPEVSSTATSEERLDRLTRTFAAGLAAYVARAGYADRLGIAPRGSEGRTIRDIPEEDPWNGWVFSLGADLEADGEEQQSAWSLGGSAQANRTTADWKVNSRASGSFRHRRFELTDSTLTDRTDSWNSSVLVVRSIARHWSSGSEIEASSSTRLNREIGGRGALALEWSLFPYEEANRRQFVVHYQVGFSQVRYEEVTVFDRIEESLFDHRVAVAYDTRQPWGDASLHSRYSNYLHDWSKYRVSFGGSTSVRLFRGFEVGVRGSYEIVHDQLYLAAGGLSDEEKLIQRRQLATGYEYNIDLGIAYRFGSIFNNVVNNRFPWRVRSF